MLPWALLQGASKQPLWRGWALFQGASKQPLWRGWALLQWVQANIPCGVAGPYSSGCKQTSPVAWLGPTPVGASKQPLWRGWALLQWVQANSPCGVAGPYSSGCKQTAPVAWLGPVLTSLVGTREDFNQMSPETRIWE